MVKINFELGKSSSAIEFIDGFVRALVSIRTSCFDCRMYKTLTRVQLCFYQH